MDPFMFFFGVGTIQTGATQATSSTTAPTMFPIAPQMGTSNAAATRCAGPSALADPTSGGYPEMEAALRELCKALMQMITGLMAGKPSGAPGRLRGVQGLLAGGAPGASARRGGAHQATARRGGGASSGATLPGGASGSAAVDVAKKYLGRNSINVRGLLPHFTAAGGQTNNCADFVSSCLETTGRLKGHYVEVNALEGALKRQGWRQIPASQARAGDVWINPSRGHVQLVASTGARKTIGSNNDRPGHQVISVRDNDPGSAVYYTRA